MRTIVVVLFLLLATTDAVSVAEKSTATSSLRSRVSWEMSLTGLVPVCIAVFVLMLLVVIVRITVKGAKQEQMYIAENKKRTSGMEDQLPNYMWLCLRDIYPVEDTVELGLSPQLATQLSDIGMHAYVLLGPDVHSSVAFQVTLTDGETQWIKLLKNVKENANLTHPTDWAKIAASRVEGKASSSMTPGFDEYDKCRQCFRFPDPVTCTVPNLQDFMKQYNKNNPVFNMATRNCCYFACSVLAHCMPSKYHSDCDFHECVDGLVFTPFADKHPTCGMVPEAVDHSVPPLGSDSASAKFFE